MRPMHWSALNTTPKLFGPQSILPGQILFAGLRMRVVTRDISSSMLLGAAPMLLLFLADLKLASFLPSEGLWH